MIELSRCRWSLKEIAPAVNKEPATFELRVSFAESDVAVVLGAVPYPSKDDEPIAAWWEYIGGNFHMMIGRRDAKTERAVDQAEVWGWKIPGERSLKDIRKVIPQVLSGREGRAVWDAAADGQPPTTLVIRLVNLEGASKSQDADPLPNMSEDELRALIVTSKIPLDRKKAKQMLKPDLINEIRKYRTVAKPSPVLV